MKHLPLIALLLPGVYGRACCTLPGQPTPVTGARMNQYIFNPSNPQTPIV